MAQVTVSTLAIRNLASRMANATDESVRKARDSVVSSAESLRDSIGGSSFWTIFDTEAPERSAQQKNLTEAIDKVKHASDTETIKKQLLYLQGTIETSRAFYSNNDSFARGLQTFIGDVEKAPALLVEKVVAPVVKGAAVMTGGTLWAAIKGLWPILLLALGAVIVYGVVTRRLGK